MKKIFLLLIITYCVFSSCKKDETKNCKCVFIRASGTESETNFKSTQEKCKEMEDNYNQSLNNAQDPANVYCTWGI